MSNTISTGFDATSGALARVGGVVVLLLFCSGLGVNRVILLFSGLPCFDFTAGGTSLTATFLEVGLARGILRPMPRSRFLGMRSPFLTGKVDHSTSGKASSCAGVCSAFIGLG